MLQNMLKAVHKMLEGADKAKVECAREVLGEVIEHLKLTVSQGTVYDSPRSYLDQELDAEAKKAMEELT